MRKNIIALIIVLLLTFSFTGGMPVVAEKSSVQAASIIDKIENIDLSRYQFDSYTQQFKLTS
ncbi:MAG: hypothetical protein K0R50_4246 [Eubacterium sp.]|nr:hypothetical protein [Eubacterium sp.]